ncbi:MAG: hypothetical protein KGR26_08850 [Cyanobacteria bacterium REEB65]|nr:hypothetical protein [Cyanobacteria bacterium REEB65]
MGSLARRRPAADQARNRLAFGAALLVAAPLLIAMARPAGAWERHDLMTRPIVERLSWLHSYRNLLVEDATSDSDPVNADYVPVYIDHLPGEREDARDILIRYSDEPAWGMDQGLSVSPLQKLAGGSQDFRQQYAFYMAGIVRVGAAPDRVDHFYQEAVAEMRAGHTYWAFRDLARCLFYLEDLSQPLRTQTFLYSWLLRARFSPKGLQTLATNVRDDYEDWVHWQLSGELRRGGGPFLEALRDPPDMAFVDPKTAALALAEYSHGKAAALLKNLDAFLPESAKSTRKVVWLPAKDMQPAKLPPSYYRVEESTADSLRIMAGTVTSVLMMAERDFAKARKQAQSTR